MAEVVTFVGYRPPPRYDSIPWTEARIQESATEDGAFTELEAVILTPVDADPAAPATRSMTTELGTAVDYWYRIVWADATSDTSVPTTPVQNVAGGSVPAISQYVEVAELARVLQFGEPATPRAPSAAQAVAMQRVIEAASAWIDSYLAPDAPYTEPYPALVVSACLDIANDMWQQEQKPYGVVVLGGEAGLAYPTRNAWRRHAQKLLPLKQAFGVG